MDADWGQTNAKGAYLCQDSTSTANVQKGKVLERFSLLGVHSA